VPTTIRLKAWTAAAMRQGLAAPAYFLPVTPMSLR